MKTTICYDEYLKLYNSFAMFHGESKEERDLVGDTQFKTKTFEDGAMWIEQFRANGEIEVDAIDENDERKEYFVKNPQTEEWIIIGNKYKNQLRASLKEDYEMARFHISSNGYWMMIVLQSNWNSSYDETRFVDMRKGYDVFQVVAQYCD